MILECYHKFLDLFSKEKSEKVSLHFKYDHKIELVNENKCHSQAVFCLKIVKNFLPKNLKKSFIEPSQALYSFPILPKS